VEGESATTTVASTSESLPVSDSTQRTAITSLATTSTTSANVFSAPLDIETKNVLRQTPGVVVELWFHNLIEDTWIRVGDNTLVGTVPQAVLIENKVFWFGPHNSSVWMFDTTAKSYTSQSISPGEKISIEYLDMAGKTGTVWFNPETGILEVLPKDE
jgi:hypothetical protein